MMAQTYPVGKEPGKGAKLEALLKETLKKRIMFIDGAMVVQLISGNHDSEVQVH